MSDLYLELRTRIPVVAEQTRIGTERLQDAQDRSGRSNESVAREIPVSEKTWRRWKKAGVVPSAALPAVARALRLELVELDPDANAGPDDRALRELRDHLDAQHDEIVRRLERIEELSRSDAVQQT